MDLEFRSLIESIDLTQIKDVTITSGVQYDHLELNGSSEWVNVDFLTVRPAGNNAVVLQAGKRLVFDGA